MLRAIRNINFDGKWIEFWFAEGPPAESVATGYHLAMKCEAFWDVVRKQELYTLIIACGVINMQVELEEDNGHNWSITRFVVPVPNANPQPQAINKAEGRS